MEAHPAADENQSATEADIEDAIARALAPHQGQLPPEVLEEFAEELRVFLYTHPLGSLLQSRTQPDDRANSGGQASPAGHQEAPRLPALNKGKVG